jgi:hypothetical protein
LATALEEASGIAGAAVGQQIGRMAITWAAMKAGAVAGGTFSSPTGVGALAVGAVTSVIFGAVAYYNADKVARRYIEPE